MSTKRRILVPLDGSRLAERMVPRLQKLLAAPGDEALLLHVRPGDNGGDPAERHGLDSVERMQAQLKELGIASTGLQRGGDPAEVICEVAEAEAPWAIAMSTHGRSGIGRWWCGSVLERVLRETRTPVLAANPGAVETAGVPAIAHPFEFQRVLVPLDGSSLARAILPYAGVLATAGDGAVHLAHVVSHPRSLDDFPAVEGVEPDAAQRAEGGAILEAGAAALAAAGRPVERHVLVGHPAEALLGLADRMEADAIALTTHGRTGLSRWAFGSVAEKLVRHATCPILVWRAPVAAAG